uniref:Uncharacterized protein n=1 Tax=Romanomermis culicivorax TaxID=13658 RepID=A0A915KUN2_ROMCU
GLENADDDLDEDFRGDGGADLEGKSKAPTQREIDDLFEELENLSDSGPECDAGADALSVRSTPKPQLRPFFNSNVDAASTNVSKNIGGVASEESKESAAASDDATTSDQELSDAPPPPTKTPTQNDDRRRSGVDTDVKTLKIVRPIAEQLSTAFGIDDLTSTNVNPVILIGVQD